jgi:hypothetical protein
LNSRDELDSGYGVNPGRVLLISESGWAMGWGQVRALGWRFGPHGKGMAGQLGRAGVLHDFGPQIFRRLEILLYFQILFQISKPNRIQIKFELQMTLIAI